MGVREKGTAIVVVVALLLPLALPAAASTTRTGATTTTGREAVEQVAQVEPPTDERPPVEVNERPPVESRRRAEPTVRDRCQVDPQPDRCPDRPVNIRHLIWRLIKAGEWRQLFHLLVRLGII